MFCLEPNFYATWRQRSGAPIVLHEEESVPPERLLQIIWFHQRLWRDKLSTLDGRRVRVLHPGYWNRGAGPDFRGAVLQFDSDPPRSGDVEIDLQISGWQAHRHHHNPAFSNVLLHVVWDSDGAETGRALEGKPPIPKLALRRVLDAPLRELSYWLVSDAANSFPESLRGQCCAPLRALPAARLSELLQQAALLRLQGKAAQIQARARQAGWEQALWEGLFRALGYKQNAWPMQRLAEVRSRICPPGIAPRSLRSEAQAASATVSVQARLLGAGALLPAELTRAQTSTDRYLRAIWDVWWRERDALSECVLPRGLWCLHGLRPANHPQRRLALAAHWLLNTDLLQRLEGWCVASIPQTRLNSTLLEHLQAGPDDFWSWHWTLRSKRLARAQPLLGSARTTDLAMNVIIPWLWVRAVEGKNEALKAEMERRFLEWPPGQDNAALKLACQRLLGGAGTAALASASAQQALLQISRDFCEQTNSLCDECPFPKLVRDWRT